ncbi:class I SAM-dependent methyltransferase [Trichlorobacter ammonificans]|uniref:Methyltransferase domain-containing protein n=1 Tax=Trichlorobacter ammonificans TaxID=2916410 RepID=A0ABN8HFI0_9BACT|nr:class I SAM-dependent methyltransferase [Trichlorobacter ammonificans]CAH2029932.1 protein of unknown function [Trichlorobacter ammonificans]
MVQCPITRVWEKLAKILPHIRTEDLGNSMKACREIQRGITGRHCGDFGDKLVQYLSIAHYIRKTGAAAVQLLEIGSLFGGSCLMKLFAMRDLGVMGKIVCIDPMSGFYGEKTDPISGIPVTKDIFYENITKFGFDVSMVDLRCCLSTHSDAYNGLDANSFATIMIDGDHSYSGVKNDWQTYSKFLKTDGLMLMDDYNDPSWPDIAVFIDELRQQPQNTWHMHQFGSTMVITPVDGIGFSADSVDPVFNHELLHKLNSEFLLDYSTLIGLAKCWLAEKDYVSALDLVKRAMQLVSVKPFDRVQGILEVGWLLDTNGLRDQAETLYMLGIQIAEVDDKQKYDLFVRLANSSWNKGAADLAADYYLRALNIDGIPDKRKFFPLLGLARHHVLKKEYAEAINFFTAALSKPDIHKDYYANTLNELVDCRKNMLMTNSSGTQRNHNRLSTTPLQINVPASYATVREYNFFLEAYPSIANLTGDLKNFQRPWVVDSVLKHVPRGGRILEIGADKCELADYLQKLGYEVWVIDVFEEFGGGIAKFEEVSTRFPQIHFTRGFIHEDQTLPTDYFDAIYSCSVIEHNPIAAIAPTFERIYRCLKPGGKSIHAIDFTVDGTVLKNHGLINAVLSLHEQTKTAEELGQEALNDIDTFYLSPQGHYNWRKFLKKRYEEYPFRKVTSFNIISHK